MAEYFDAGRYTGTGVTAVDVSYAVAKLSAIHLVHETFHALVQIHLHYDIEDSDVSSSLLQKHSEE